MEYTADQQRVIDTRNRNILVSAAAGSGKTAVLVERIIQMITDSSRPVDIDRLLIVTFTSAAAAQMRERISKAVADKLGKNPEDEHLQRQSALIHNAQITTIDSFCLFVIRNNFNEIGIDPCFRVADESEIKLLEADVMDKLLEDMHEEAWEGFLSLVERYSTGTDEKRIEEALLRLYRFSMSYPFPEEWLKERLLDYSAQNGHELSQTKWFAQMLRYIDTILAECASRLYQALEISKRADGPAQYIDNLVSDIELIESLKGTSEYARLYAMFSQCGFARLSAKKNPDCDETLKETVKSIRDEVKKNVAVLKTALFGLAPEDMISDMASCREAVEELVRLALLFKERLDSAKREKNIIDFSDMEHFALDILLARNESGELVLRDTALELQDYFEEIMIDEYQDSNEVQELLLKSISGEARGRCNRFMVGDVKQSIYKFRLARPEIFMEKYDTYATNDEAKSSCLRIDLSTNFRSRKEVTDAANFICSQLMGKQVGNVEYDEHSALYAGAVYPKDESSNGENPYQTELLIAMPELQEDDDGKLSPLSPKEIEASLVASRIKKMVGHLKVADSKTGGLRAARYSDIVILFRAASGWDEDFRRILGERGIPVHVTSKTGYFETVEIQAIVSFLRTLDNPLQDVAFFGTMKLPFFGFSDEEIAEIRCFCLEHEKSADKRLFLYEEAKYYLENAGDKSPLAGKLEKLFAMILDYRKKAAYTPIKDLIRALIDETGYGAYAGSMPGGAQRLANLEILLEKAGTFQNTSFYGLFHFIRYLETIHEQEVDFGEANILDENADVVRIMTIHKSKGLEFPICLVCGLSKQFNMLDTRAAILMDAELGIGVDYIDPQMRIKRKNMRKNVVAQRMKEDARGEDLRVLYVAMTRAKEKLILTGYADDLERKIKSGIYLTMEEGEKLPYSAIMGAGSYMDLILASLMRHRCMADIFDENGLEFHPHKLPFDDAAIKVELCSEALGLNEEIASKGLSVLLERELDRAEALADKELREKIEKKFAFKYPYAYLEGLTVKTTVSELKRKSHEEMLEEAKPLIVPEREEYIPDFAAVSEKDTAQTGVRYGLAVHKIMELLSFDACLEYNGENDAKRLYAALSKEREGWLACGRASKEELACVSVSKICEFFKSPLAARMIRAHKNGGLYKEQPFVLGRNAHENGGELMLIQGVIDVFFYEEDGIVLADYKTDKAENDRQLAERYRTQLDCYQQALEQITGKNVKERYIYSFALQREIRV